MKKDYLCYRIWMHEVMGAYINYDEDTKTHSYAIIRKPNS